MTLQQTAFRTTTEKTNSYRTQNIYSTVGMARLSLRKASTTERRKGAG